MKGKLQELFLEKEKSSFDKWLHQSVLRLTLFNLNELPILVQGVYRLK